nr:CatB-related O-acetyltransferase [Pontibacter sp. Tf4]
MFYSTAKQNGYSLTGENKIEETKPIIIGNDVFIGMNVTILDGVTIGDGAVIGAGSVVSKDIPPYAVAYGNPIKVVKYRFSDSTIKRLLETKWWDWDYNKLKKVEEDFFEVDKFLNCSITSK